MPSSPDAAAWQAEPVSSPSRIAAITLAMLSIDSAFAWPAMPYVAEAIATTTVPLLVAIRVVRGLPRSLEMAGVTLVAAQLLALRALAQMGLRRPTSLTAAVTMAAVLSATGL